MRTPPTEEVRRATVRMVVRAHHPHDDEDLHPSALDPSERQLELALRDLHASRARPQAQRPSGR